MKEFAGKKITKTSFLDDSFRKNLESALRFGNPLLVQVGGRPTERRSCRKAGAADRWSRGCLREGGETGRRPE